ncbi:MAG TPA: serine/threonine-protein kinase, partial [Kofleriaceae bacterium]|nr:serine/threonine-protein kinase [Kofleriaceae bacterium]
MLGLRVGNYELVAKIGEGGMGCVYLGEHKTLGRLVAVKVLRADLSTNPEIAARFHNEARAATAIRHPGVVEVYDVGVLDDRSAYIIMEFLDGESLAARIRRGRCSVAATLAILRAIARALQAAHELAIVHRDLKPENVFLVPDPELASGERVKLLDFGIAKLTPPAGTSRHTQADVVMGTPTYMAPEQCRGAGAVDHRADLYALGCIAYEMLCDAPPFVADGAGEVIARHLYFAPVAPRELRPDLPAEVEALVLALLRKEPRERPSSAIEVVRMIDRLSATAVPALADERRDASVVTQLPLPPERGVLARAALPAVRDAAQVLAEAEPAPVPVRVAVPMSRSS